MIRTFRASKMIERVKAEGRGDMLDAETLAFIKSLDGRTGTDYNWMSVVKDEPLVWIADADGKNGTYVNAKDCD